MPLGEKGRSAASGTKGSGSSRPALRNRLRAWWEGYDQEEYEAWLKSKEVPEEPEDEPAPPPPPPANEEPLRSIAWKPKRIKIANLIWGEGYCGPGGSQYVIDLVKLLGLTPEMSVLIVGGGLGGPARALAANYGCYVSAYEASPELAEAGSELSVGAGLGRKAPIEHMDFESMAPFTRKFDAAVAKEALLTIRHKTEVVREVFASLKSSRLFLVTDYVLGDQIGLEDPVIADWLADEPTPCHVVGNDTLVSLFERAGFSVRVKEDQSDHYRSLIARSWADAGQLLSQLMEEGEEGKSLAQVLSDEAALWAKRSHLLEQKKLSLMRYVLEKSAY